MGGEVPSLHVADPVEPGGQGPRRGDPRIQLTQRTRRGVPRVGEGGFARGHPLLVELRKRRQRQVDLATDLDDGRIRRSGGQHGEWYRGDGPEVGRDVFADLPVAPGSPHYQTAVLVSERNGQPIDLGLKDEAQ